MEGDPFAVVEAMTIAAYATGCERGYVYLRGEYPLAQPRSRPRSPRRARRGFLGDDVLGEGFAFDIEIRKGAGAYICGEETAIFNSIEGYRGEPRNKPPFPVDDGLFGKPTVVNNVETLVNVLPIVLEGGAGLRRDRHRGIDRDEAVLPLRPRRAPGRLRGAVRRRRCASCSSSPAAWPAARRCRRCCSAARPAASSGRTSSTCRSPSRARATAKTTLGSGVVARVRRHRRPAATS